MKRKTFCLVSVLLFLFVGSNTLGQEVWFNWFDHISRIQKEWISIEDETFSLWNNLTRFQDFGGLRDKTNSLVNSIRIMRKVHDKDMKAYGDRYPELFSLSSQYLSVLEQTISQLEHILSELYKKSQDLFQYSWKEYQDDTNSYNTLVETYHKLGNEMNLVFQKIGVTRGSN